MISAMNAVVSFLKFVVDITSKYVDTHDISKYRFRVYFTYMDGWVLTVNVRK